MNVCKLNGKIFQMRMYKEPILGFSMKLGVT